MRRFGQTSYNIVMISLVVLILFLNFIPLYQITVNAFKSVDDYNGAKVYEGQGRNTFGLPRTWTLSSFLYSLRQEVFIRAFLNTIIISTGCLIIVELLGAVTALILAQYRLWFTDRIVTIVIGAHAIPLIMTMITTFRVTRAFGWLDTYQGAIVALSAQSLPFVIFLFYSYYLGLPKELLEAAEIDGATFLQVAFRIVFPMSGPIVATVGVLVFIQLWATYLIGLIILRQENMHILSMVIQNAEVALRLRTPVYYASFLIMSLPMLAVARWAQRYISTGMLAGAAKG